MRERVATQTLQAASRRLIRTNYKYQWTTSRPYVRRTGVMRVDRSR